MYVPAIFFSVQVKDQILAAASTEGAVEGLKKLKSFGSNLRRNAVEDSLKTQHSY